MELNVFIIIKWKENIFTIAENKVVFLSSFKRKLFKENGKKNILNLDVYRLRKKYFIEEEIIEILSDLKYFALKK